VFSADMVVVGVSALLPTAADEPLGALVDPSGSVVAAPECALHSRATSEVCDEKAL
jgi:hypothetical protein